jgi:hypothetical protein
VGEKKMRRLEPILVVLFVISLVLPIRSVFALVMWSQTYEIGQFQSANSVIEKSDGGYVMAGSIHFILTGKTLIWLVKSDVQGIPEFPTWTSIHLLMVILMTTAAILRKKFKTPTQTR